MKRKYTKNNSSGFTLIEIMVAVSIFAIVMVIAIGSVLSIVAANKKAQAISSVVNNLNFAIESMVRDLRTGHTYNCDSDTVSVSGDDCPNGDTSNKISFTSSQKNENVTYGLEIVSGKGRIYKSISGEESYITPEEVNIDRLDFYVVNTDPGSADKKQPKILLTIGGEFEGFGSLTRFDLQTTVSQRKLDV